MTLMTAMTTSISEVMETMFYLPVEPGGQASLESCGILSQPCTAGHLTFKGDVSGSLFIVFPDDVAAEMTQNFMGETSEDLKDEFISGTVTETVNMVCGNALKKMDSSIAYELGIPERVTDMESLKKGEVTIINTEFSKIAVGLLLDE